MSVNSITPTDLKTILHSKRANIYYLEKCRIQVNGGRVEYVTQEGKESFYWNIPIANTTAVMLGMGTSVTQMAMREFARAGVMVGFCGTDGTPLYSANEVDIDVSWLSPQSEYRPTAYLQNWVSFWFDEAKRLQAAKQFQLIRLQQIEKQWAGLRMLRETSFQPDREALETILKRAKQGMENAQDHTSLMLQEAQLTKSLYKVASLTVGYGTFTRAKRGGGADMANRFLDQGNYLAYGLAAVAAWVTGIPHGLAVMHGKTRRGGLVFDIADLIKDALVMPQAFIAAMPAIARHKTFRERAKEERFHWQNKAWDVASALREKSAEQGFFGINMASTGCGKTFANARIMYALADEQAGCRFSVALGLRTLTLQTGQALQSRLGLDDDTLAVVTGAAAVKELYQGNDAEDNSSASDETFFASHHYVHYEGATSSGIAQQWLAKEPALNRLVSAPVLVTTIDHLMPATEGVRGGRQIPAMLRLLTSDLVLDEPDDFDVDDLHALCRLVNWAGMLGSRVLLSSATLPPALTEALFEAYREGRRAWQVACGQSDRPMSICCAWFDEYGAQSQDVADDAQFRQAHGDFVRQRIKRLPDQPRLRLGKLAAVEAHASRNADVVSAVAQTLHQQMFALHGHQGDIGISFPAHGIKPGAVLRLHGTQTALSELESLIWRKGLSDYCMSSGTGSLETQPGRQQA